ncbi:TetR/AcrR family transcriptional regulator [Paracoccus amoyensis]|nr:TetR-like C-terminal domain-containing protein [Paracoccus amoyensis]
MHNDILNGLGLHGQAIVAAMQIMQVNKEHRPTLLQVSKILGVPAADIRRIFKNEENLLIAIAEQGLVRLIDATTKAIVKVDQDDPIGQYMALGDAYLEWADQNRSQFRLITNAAVFDALRTPQTRRYLDSLNELMVRILERARAAGLLHHDEDINTIVVSSRVFAHGLARYIIDSRMKDFRPNEPQLESAKEMLNNFIIRYLGQPARSKLPI